jgi:hypothetical protein
MSESPPPILRKSAPFPKALAITAILILALGGLWWWHNRPIRPVVLTSEEKAVVEAKVEALQKPAEPVYEKGSKDIILTERELNGLLNQNSNLGETLRFELVTNAIHARLETDLDPDLPIFGGKRLKARARFLVGGAPGKSALVLDDLTVWGISLPNDWLCGLKGQDLLGEALGGGIGGVEEFKVERGRLFIRLKD